jgi:hypothetical protein
MPRALAEIIDRNVPVEMRRATKHFLSERATPADVQCRDLCEGGFGYDRISKETGLTKGQVGYRLKMLGISPMDYRRGTSELAKKIIKLISEDKQRYFDMMVSNVRRYLKDK